MNDQIFEAIRVKVKFSGGAYVTSQVRGHRASSTMDASAAVESIGQKIFGRRYHGCTLIADHGGCQSDWEIQAHAVDSQLEA